MLRGDEEAYTFKTCVSVCVCVYKNTEIDLLLKHFVKIKCN